MEKNQNIHNEIWLLKRNEWLSLLKKTEDRKDRTIKFDEMPVISIRSSSGESRDVRIESASIEDGNLVLHGCDDTSDDIVIDSFEKPFAGELTNLLDYIE